MWKCFDKIITGKAPVLWSKLFEESHPFSGQLLYCYRFFINFAQSEITPVSWIEKEAKASIFFIFLKILE